MIILTANDKLFGKNFIDYTIRNRETKEILDSGKCKDFGYIRKLFIQLREQHGVENVKLLTR
ncbi:hypothetical protein [Bacillus sp. T33-2]|uniref:hypothetical protein n=1 Tax=Bacillus sp. T33-2 TaxID=2054168 RepID=UPI000C763034|nr:hypothetical protein [Bacillus sp. T33-2]PLR99614.1 hypothetical protein CVD19_00700 [Bacillus sp. T33-2]